MSELIPETLLHTQSRARLVMNGLANLICHRAAAPETENYLISQLVPLPGDVMNYTNPISEPNLASEKAVPEAAPNYKLLDSLLEPAYLQAKREGITSAIGADPDLIRLKNIREAKYRNAEDGEEAYRAGNRTSEKSCIYNLLSLDAEEATINPESRDKFGELEYQLYQIDRRNLLVVDAVAEEAQALMGFLKSQDAIGDAEAPYANYKDTTRNTRTVITNSTVTSYLHNKAFTNYIRAEDGGVIVDSRQPGSFDVPLALITYVAGFDGWTGLTGHGIKTWQTKEGLIREGSLEAIQYYAGLPTDLPPVNEIVVKISRDGSIHCDNGEGDSHRIAAAVLRGQATVKASRLRFVRAI